MIPLKCIVEYAILQGQSYDLGKDFVGFQRTVDGTTEQIKQKFEQSINAQLKGKRIRARASRGYKQFEKDYEFDVSRVTIDDYYDNYVVVAHDESGKKKREYFLKPGSKIQIIGLASGIQNSDKGPNDPYQKLPTVVASPRVTTASPKATPPIKETTSNYDAYSIESIIDDVTPWLKIFMKDPRVGVRGFIKSLGWMKTLPNRQTVAIYDLTIPLEDLKVRLSSDNMVNILKKVSKPTGNINVQFELKGFRPFKDHYKVRIKKTMIERGPEDKYAKTFQIDEPETT